MIIFKKKIIIHLLSKQFGIKDVKLSIDSELFELLKINLSTSYLKKTVETLQPRFIKVKQDYSSEWNGEGKKDKHIIVLLFPSIIVFIPMGDFLADLKILTVQRNYFPSLRGRGKQAFSRENLARRSEAAPQTHRRCDLTRNWDVLTEG